MLETSFESGVFTVRLPEIVNTENISSIEKEVAENEAYAIADVIILDAENLQSISSVGLRWVLSLKKERYELKITNVNDDCYLIFEDTGFTQLMKIERRLRFVSVEGLHILGSGVYGSSYQLDEEKVLKVYFGVVSMDEVNRIIHNIRQAFVRGIPTIIPFAVVETDRGLGTVFEMVNSNCFSSRIADHPEKVSEEAAVLAALARKLAETDLTDSGVISRRELLFHSIDDVAALFDADEMDTLRYYITSVPKRATAVHGDLHARNIMMENDDLLLIDMDDFSQGHPVWELSAIDRIYHMSMMLGEDRLRDIYGFGKDVSMEDFLNKVAGIPVDLIRRLWDGFVDEYFAGFTPEAKVACLALSDFYAGIMMLRDIIEQTRTVRDDPEKLNDRRRVFRQMFAVLQEMDFESLKDGFALWTA